MSIAKWCIDNKVFSLVITVVLIVGGIISYSNLGRLEDPEFTIKDALVITQYPGASPKEVAEEVTEPLETSIQQLGQLKELKSMSRAGVSTITVTIKDKYDKFTLPQVWDELRRKVNDVKVKLPPGASTSIVQDDYGDVFGVLVAISGEGFTYKELYDFADFLRRELLLVDDVAKATLWGAQQERIYVEISRAKMAQLGISLDRIYSTLSQQNFVTDSGSVRVGDEFIRITPTGAITSIKDIQNLLIQGGDRLIYLKDIATVTRDYIDPPAKHLRLNGNNAIALGFSTVSGGNVVTMGNALIERMEELKIQIPAGISIEPIYYQATAVTAAVDGFIINLVQAIVIVIFVLMIFMGLRSGLLIGLVLLLTVCATFVVMRMYNIDLQRISLGALIIALGMLVDNAIVVTEGILIRLQKGQDKLFAATEVVKQNMWPLLGATIIAVMAFAAIGLSQDSTGEYTRSLFYVLLISLGLSWVIAITITPLLCTLFLKVSNNEQDQRDPYRGIIFVIYKKILKFTINFRYLTIFSVVGLLLLSIVGFNLLEDSFFPDSTNNQLLVHYWLPEGTDIRKTSADLKQIEKYVQSQNGVKNVATFVGGGAPRYMLVYAPEKEYTSYGMLLVTVEDYKTIDKLKQNIQQYLTQNYLDANPKLEKIRLGPGGGYNVEVRFSGSDPNTLRMLAKKAKDIMREDGGFIGVRDNWRERVKLVKPQYSEAKARRVGISRQELSDSLKYNFLGMQVGLYREGDDLIPILSRAPLKERDDISNIQNMQIWSRAAQKVIPIRQIVEKFDTTWEDAIWHRQDKKLTITAQADAKTEATSVVFARIKSKIENIELPIGYEMAWGGEYEDSTDAKQGLSKNLPVTFVLMVLVTIALFNALRQPLIIWLTVPLAIIGVTFGLLATGQSFGFMALLGFLSLSGMLIKNSIVLIDDNKLD